MTSNAEEETMNGGGGALCSEGMVSGHSVNGAPFSSFGWDPQSWTPRQGFGCEWCFLGGDARKHWWGRGLVSGRREESQGRCLAGQGPPQSIYWRKGSSPKDGRLWPLN